MKQLHRGQEDEVRVKMLLKFTNITKDSMIDAIMDHLVEDSKRSWPIKSAARRNGIEPCNLSRSLATLNEAANDYEELKEYEQAKFISVK